MNQLGDIHTQPVRTGNNSEKQGRSILILNFDAGHKLKAFILPFVHIHRVLVSFEHTPRGTSNLDTPNDPFRRCQTILGLEARMRKASSCSTKFIDESPTGLMAKSLILHCLKEWCREQR
ncbi:hypothetical protein CEXT_617671 [Caerostris extrusa]|uniref:Uncharacterized protein n=1 Tax=Caerostris extrusa TaxID=172846 RepID=A0AAV4PSD1_CAEEX|nr:hypothetical protein CEXT_617671 [Caerostris extrusa]